MENMISLFGMALHDPEGEFAREVIPSLAPLCEVSDLDVEVGICSLGHERGMAFRIQASAKAGSFRGTYVRLSTKWTVERAFGRWGFVSPTAPALKGQIFSAEELAARLVAEIRAFQEAAKSGAWQPLEHE